VLDSLRKRQSVYDIFDSKTSKHEKVEAGLLKKNNIEATDKTKTVKHGRGVKQMFQTNVAAEKKN